MQAFKRSSVQAFKRSSVAVAILAVFALALNDAYGKPHSTVVVATGDPVKDVRAIQEAADRGGTVRLRGHFSFATPAMQAVDPLLASGWCPAAAEVRIARSVDILGERDARGEMATIESGTIPLYVDAPGRHVTIRGVRFVRAGSVAVLVRAVGGFEISESAIQGIVPGSSGASGIAIDTRGSMPLPSSPGQPANVSGNILIASNEIDAVGGTAQAPTAGVNVFGIGESPDREVDLDIISNRVSNVTAPAIHIRRVRGRVRVVGNTVQTSAETVGDVDAVRLVNGTSILMANNAVECRWPNAAAIQVFSPFVEWPTRRVVVQDNEVTMAPAPDATLGDFSAGISIRGFAESDTVRRNRITGRAGAALSMYVFRGGEPADNAFIDNRVENFHAAVADIVVGSGVARGRIVGLGSISDRGSATLRELSSAPADRPR